MTFPSGHCAPVFCARDKKWLFGKEKESFCLQDLASGAADLWLLRLAGGTKDPWGGNISPSSKTPTGAARTSQQLNETTTKEANTAIIYLKTNQRLVILISMKHSWVLKYLGKQIKGLHIIYSRTSTCANQWPTSLDFGLYSVNIIIINIIGSVPGIILYYI